MNRFAIYEKADRWWSFIPFSASINKKLCVLFVIDEDEIAETAGMRFDKPRLAEIFRRIENDERIWSANKEVKIEAIQEMSD